MTGPVPQVDRRAMIIERLVELLSNFTVPLQGDTLSGPQVIVPANFYHNRGELPGSPDYKVPAVILLDADEELDPGTPPPKKGRELTQVPTVLMRMVPEIYIVLNVRKPANTNVGEDLNAARAALLNLVLHDQQLLQITGSNGSVMYSGCVTDLGRNRVMRGQMGLTITFTYPLIADELLGFTSN